MRRSAEKERQRSAGHVEIFKNLSRKGRTKSMNCINCGGERGTKDFCGKPVCLECWELLLGPEEPLEEKQDEQEPKGSVNQS